MSNMLLRMKRVIISFINSRITRLFILTIVILISGAFGLSYFEKTPHVLDAFWWSFVTITTVGYGDISPATIGGRITGIIVMVFGISILGMFTATIASAFVTGKIMDEKKFMANPPMGYTVKAGDQLVVIAQERPHFARQVL